MSRQSAIARSLTIPFRFVILLLTIYFSEYLMKIDLGFLGIYPRTAWGLIGVVAAPLIHANLQHLVSNVFPLLILGIVLFYFYDRIAIRVFLLAYFPTGLLVWCFGASNFHIGASGIIYSLAFFLMAFGFLRKDFLSIVISFFVVLFYGGIIWGIFPNQPGVSWESHFFGALMGVVSASTFRKHKKVSSTF